MARKMWAMSQTWHELLFLHWSVEPAQIQRYIPDGLELDLYDNRAWIGIVLFKARGTRPRFMPPYLGINFNSAKPMAHYAVMKKVHFFPPVIEK